MAEDFEPRLVGFACNWCTYVGADLAGSSRFQYSPNIRVIRVMCSGRVDPTFIILALTRGSDGVLIGGCHPGDCHYMEGNYLARRRITALKTVLKHFGLDKRIRLEWIAASEGQKFASVTNEMAEDVKKMGPSPIGGELV